MGLICLLDTHPWAHGWRQSWSSLEHEYFFFYWIEHDLSRLLTHTIVQIEGVTGTTLGIEPYVVFFSNQETILDASEDDQLQAAIRASLVASQKGDDGDDDDDEGHSTSDDDGSQSEGGADLFDSESNQSEVRAAAPPTGYAVDRSVDELWRNRSISYLFKKKLLALAKH